MNYYNNGYYPQFNYRQSQMQQYVPQSISQPVIHADIIQVNSENEAENFGVAAGNTQLMCAKDDSAFYVKTCYPNGESRLEVYDRRQPKSPTKPDYITREELNEILSRYQSKKEIRNESIRKSQSTESDESDVK